MKYFIKHVTSYLKFTSSKKGQEIEKILNGLENTLLNDKWAVQQLYESLSIAVHKINIRYPRYKRWVTSMTGYTHIVIRPETERPSAFGDDYVASITIVPVEMECVSDEIHRYIKRKLISE